MTLETVVKVVVLIAAAIGVGIAVTLGAALLGHQFLVITVGEEGIPAIDDTPLMFALVAGAYVSGGLAWRSWPTAGCGSSAAGRESRPGRQFAPQAPTDRTDRTTMPA